MTKKRKPLGKPNAKTIAAMRQLNAGGSETFMGSTRQLMKAIGKTRKKKRGRAVS